MLSSSILRKSLRGWKRVKMVHHEALTVCFSKSLFRKLPQIQGSFWNIFFQEWKKKSFPGPWLWWRLMRTRVMSNFTRLASSHASLPLKHTTRSDRNHSLASWIPTHCNPEFLHIATLENPTHCSPGKSYTLQAWKIPLIVILENCNLDLLIQPKFPIQAHDFTIAWKPGNRPRGI